MIPAQPDRHTDTGIGAQLAPHAAVGLLVVAGAALHAAAEATGHPANVAVTVAVVAFVLAILVATKRGEQIACPKSRVRLRAFLLVAAGWLTTVTAAGISWGAVEILAVLVYALSLHWWRKRRIPNVTPIVDTPALSEYAERWDTYLGDTGCVLAGSKLTSPEIIGSGIRFTLRPIPGKHDRSSVTGVYEKIRGGLGLDLHQDLIIENHPRLPQPHLQITIVTTSPIKQDILWPGPAAFNPETGRIDLGPFADGIGTATWKAYSKTRLFGGYLQGGTNAGKSRTLESIAVTLAASETHPTVIMYADGQGGASSPRLLARYSDFVARDITQTQVMLQGLLLVMQLRQDENDLEGLSGFTPAPDRPGIIAILDECHKLTIEPVVQRLVASIAREGGKVGIALILASQDPLLSAFGGSGEGNLAETIRSNLLMGNGLIFKSKSKDARQVFGVTVDPSTFPDLPGYAFVVDPAEGARSAPFRAYHFTDAQADEWPARIHWRSLDQGAANVWGPEYINRHAIAQAERDAKRARVEAMKAGRPVPAAPITRTIPAITLSAPAAFPVAQFPIWNPASMTPVKKAEPVGPGHAKVAAALTDGRVLRDGYTTPAVLAQAVGLSERQINNILRDLVEAGVVCKGDIQGRYYPTKSLAA